MLILCHTCESPSATCLYMFYEIHDGTVVLACCLHPHTQQGIYNICENKGLATLKEVKYLYTMKYTRKNCKSDNK